MLGIASIIVGFGGDVSIVGISARNYDPLTDTYSNSSTSKVTTASVQKYVGKVSEYINAGAYTAFCTPDIPIKEGDKLTWNNKDYTVKQCFPFMVGDDVEYYEVVFSV